MSKRLTFKCWNTDCGETYTLLRETEGVRILIVQCPYCGAEAEVDLMPYLSNAIPTFKGDAPQNQEQTLNLPDILPTRPRSQPQDN